MGKWLEQGVHKLIIIAIKYENALHLIGKDYIPL
jgi:hypothetical protein